MVQQNHICKSFLFPSLSFKQIISLAVHIGECKQEFGKKTNDLEEQSSNETII